MKPIQSEIPLPEGMILDVVNTCNLACPLCPTGSGKLNMDRRVMSLTSFQTLIDKVPSLKRVTLFNWGEPFLNPDIFSMISYARERKLKVVIHSNFSFKKESSFFTNIISSGLDHLTISLDGASPESYSQYRVGGDFDLVLSNLRKLVEEKKRCPQSDLRIEWKLVINKYNENEIDAARQMALDMGVEFRTHAIGLSDDLPDREWEESLDERKLRWLPERIEYRHPHYRGEYTLPLFNEPCKQLFKIMVVGSNGDVFPCCWVTDRRNSFGNLLEQSLEEIWYGDKYRNSRSLFNGNDCPEKEETVCTSCTNFKKHSPLLSRGSKGSLPLAPPAQGPPEGRRRQEDAGKRLFVIAESRSGSNWLVETLNNHPDIFMLKEIFKPGPRRQFAEETGDPGYLDTGYDIDYLEKKLEKSGSGNRFSGCKILASQAARFMDFFQFLDYYREANYIFLSRRNTVKAEISSEISRTFKRFHVRHREAELLRVTLDRESFLQRLQWRKTRNDYTRAMLDLYRIQSISIVYEDLFADKETWVKRILEDLNLECCPTLIQSLFSNEEQSNPFLIRDIVENYDEMDAFLKSYPDYYRMWQEEK